TQYWPIKNATAATAASNPPLCSADSGFPTKQQVAATKAEPALRAKAQVAGVGPRDNLMNRVLSGAALLAGVLAALWFLPAVYLLGVAVIIALLAFREYVDIAARAGGAVSRPAGGMATALTCVAVGVPGMPLDVALAGITLGLAAV